MASKTGIKVKLIGQDGNAFAILGTVVREMRRKKVDEAIINEYKQEARSGDYNHLLAVTMDYVEVV